MRGNAYMDVLPWIVGSDGIIRGPAGDGRIAAVTRDDAADVAVSVLLGEGHSGATYDVPGPESLTMHGGLRRFSRGPPAETSPIARRRSRKAYEARGARYGAPGWELEGWVTSLAGVATGELDMVGDAVLSLAGHAPMTFCEFLRRYPENYRHLLPA